MTGEKSIHAQTLEDLYAMMERDRDAAEVIAETTFQAEVNAAVNTIAEISSVASARILADTQVASAKILIDAEVAATRLSTGAEMAIAEVKKQARLKPKASVEASIVAIGHIHSTQVTESARHAVEAIERDAQAAIAKLRQLGNAAIEEIHTFAMATSLRSEAATRADELMKTFKETPHTMEEAAAEGGKAAAIILAAAKSASDTLQQKLDATLRNIHAVTEEACQAITIATAKAVERVEAARGNALERIGEAMRQHLS